MRPTASYSYAKPPSDAPAVVRHAMFVTRSITSYAYFATRPFAFVTDESNPFQPQWPRPNAPHGVSARHAMLMVTTRLPRRRL